MISRSFIVSTALVVALSMLGFSPLDGQTPDSVAAEAREIFETVMSPYCPGRTISNCPSPEADQLRDVITRKLTAGEAQADIKEELYEVFGDELRTIPKASGFGLLAWIVPGIGFLIGVWWIVGWMRRSGTSTTDVGKTDTTGIDSAAKSKLEAEMRELDSIT